MRLIDADNLLKALKAADIDTSDLVGKVRKSERLLCIQYINTEPTVCAENVDKVMIEHETIALGKGLQMGYEQARKDFERPQGEWIIKTGVVSNYSACSLCDFADYRHLHFNYCPGCGARMSFGGKLCGGES